MTKSLLPLCIGLAALALAPTAPAARQDDDGEYFRVIELPGKGRSVASDIVDLDGDGRRDLVRVVFSGMPPEETRRLCAHLQDEEGGFASGPSHCRPLPPGTAAYDLVDLLETPGVELVLLRQDRLTLVSMAGPEGATRDLPFDGPSSVGAVEDERGLGRLHMVRPGPAEVPWLWVPQMGRYTALSADGVVRARIETGGRANYYVPYQPGVVTQEADIQLFFDAPRLAWGDVDGDGRADAVTATRHELRIFRQREDQTLPRQADQRIPLRKLSELDHVRGSGGVISILEDLDGDGLLDLMLTQVQGNLSDARSHSAIFLNRGGGWKLDAPDVEFREESTLASNILVDLDGDRRLELVRLSVRFNLLELVETLLTREVDVRVSVHRYRPEVVYAEEPDLKRPFSVPWDFETFVPAGFIPSLFADFNGDGHLDLLNSGGGSEVEVFLGGRARDFGRKVLRQEMPTQGELRTGDLDGDGLSDFVIYDPYDVDGVLRVGRNKGALPGSPPRLDVASPPP